MFFYISWTYTPTSNLTHAKPNHIPWYANIIEASKSLNVSTRNINERRKKKKITHCLFLQKTVRSLTNIENSINLQFMLGKTSYRKKEISGLFNTTNSKMGSWKLKERNKWSFYRNLFCPNSLLIFTLPLIPFPF